VTLLPLEALPIDVLRRRSSSKWRTYPDDVLPLFVAETDFALAPTVSAALARALELGDTGYTPPDPGVRAAFAGFAERRWNWGVDPSGLRTTGDVMTGVVEILRKVIAPGDRVVVMPPVYPPFFEIVAEAGGTAQPVPLQRGADGWVIDLDGVADALAAGARAVLLCNPHNPTGTVHPVDVLASLAELAERYGVAVVSDEIHGPLAMAPVDFTPFLSASAAAARVGYAVTSASKAFNLAGLKCAQIVTADPATTAVIRDFPVEVEWRTGHWGAIANVAAFDRASDEWLDRLLVTLDRNRRLVADALAAHLPDARYQLPQAGYLAWIDVTAYGWGDNPAVEIRRRAGVALHQGPLFGPQGIGHVRLNFGCAPEVIEEAIARVGALVTR
jgi:cysteine-S-conjugate beta-lyase